MNYPKLKKIKKTYFSCREISNALDISLESARVTATRLVGQEVLIRAKRDIYLFKDKWDSLSREEKFIMANLIQTPSYISLMTAMDYYEVTTQVQRDFVESIAIYRTKEIEIEKSTFNYSKINRVLYFGFLREKGFFMATPEKAFVDAFYLMSLKRYNFDLASIDFGRLNVSAIRKIAKRFPLKTQELLERKYGYFKKA